MDVEVSEIPKDNVGQTRMSAPPPSREKSFVSHAGLIGVLTFVSRVLGMARESVAAFFFGAGPIWSAFTVAFTIPNLFRKLFGEGALSAAFIPLYAQAVKRESGETANGDAASADIYTAGEFANASVNLLCFLLSVITILGEGVLWWMLHRGRSSAMAADRILAIRLTMLMLPYVLLVCGQAFLGGILQVHHFFGAPAAAPILLNLFLIAAIVLAAKLFDLKTDPGQTRGVFLLSITVIAAGVVQVAMMAPALRRAGFRFRPLLHFWTSPIKKMLKLTLPVALGAGVLQIGVLMDKGISFLMASGVGTNEAKTFHLFGWTLERYPMVEGAAARLNWAQFLYQFPLGVFATALATAIFPKLSTDALGTDTDRERFRGILRRGIEAALFIGLPASVGMIVVRYPAVRLLFQHGKFTATDTKLVAISTAVYSAAIWAFSLQQILNRGYYALHDTTTPLVWGIVNLLLNLVVELPLLWILPNYVDKDIAETGMAWGTLVSFALQAVVMTMMLSRRVGGVGLGSILPGVAKMLIASAVMWLACWAVQRTPIYPAEDVLRPKLRWAIQLCILMTTGGVVYLGACAAMGINVLEHLRRRRR
jgi:putative peptidoglycan lipid II flippase